MPSRSYARRSHSRSAVTRLVPLPIIKRDDPQPSIFHQKLKAADAEARARIIDAILRDGGEILIAPIGFSNTPFSAVSKPHRPRGTPITELSWTPPAPPICAYVNKSLKQVRNPSSIFRPPHPHPNPDSRYLPQHVLKKPEESARTGSLTSCSHTALRYLVRSRRASGAPTASSTSLNTGRRSTAKWRSSTNEQPAKGYAVPPSFLSFSRLTLPALIASVLLTAKKDRCAALYDCIRAHIVTLCACKTGSKVIWLLYVHPIQFILNPLSSVGFSSDWMRAYYGY
ncbi:hypothetical protein B0H14DRAFT_3514867 [Mycena olivaceomarginata]|nr:hypothetical protein B0H14DRAFT_3514867 [Mycena olivaceomarginata]